MLVTGQPEERESGNERGYHGKGNPLPVCGNSAGVGGLWIYSVIKDILCIRCITSAFLE